ncbi:MAG: ADP-ribosylglycohydrolase family protein [Methanobrevibacter sp.]|nr:ADP-ribosylglycohydrolase family protein [Methanobrevibacter sp.]
MKVRDGIVGLTVGDALGVPVEFRSGKYLLENPVTGMMGHGTYDMPRGTWSDDTSLTLATMQSIVNKKAIDLEDIMNEFSLYVSESKYCQYEVFDYGHTTIQAIRKFDSGYPVSQCGGRGDRDNGNGSLMRILPLAFISGITYEDIENVSSLTHAHMKSRIACVLYVEIAKSMLEKDLEISEHIKNSCEKIKKHYEDSDYLMDFESILEMDFHVDEGRSYVIKTLEAVLYCLLETGSYKEAVLKAVNLGRDTDTVAAITGGLAGIYYGYDDIPAEWIKDIPQIDFVLDLCGDYEKLCLEM